MGARRIGGIEVQLRELIRHLAARNCHTVLCFLGAPSPEVHQYLSAPNVTWEKLSSASENSWQASLDLSRILRQYKPDLLHLQFTPLLSPAAWLGRLHGARKIFFTDHHSRPEGYIPERKPAWKRAAASLLQLPVSGAVAVSEYNRRLIAATGPYPSSRVCTIYNGVDLDRQSEISAGAWFRARYRIPADRILITQVSQMKPEKGVADLLEAARLALANYPDLHFAFVGDGKHLETYARRAVEMGIGEHVTWTGLIKDPVAEGVYAASDIVCLASRWQEAFGLVLAEAMSCKNPVVATRAGGIPEVVEDGKTGFLVNPGDTGALAEKLLRLAKDSELRAAMGQAGRERAVTHFNVRTNTLRLMELYGDF
jgi:spore coat protein SA